jgi:hypothetical protein
MYLALGRFSPPFCIHHSSFCLPPSVALGAFLLSAFYFLLWLGGGFGVALKSHWGRNGVALGSQWGAYQLAINRL